MLDHKASEAKEPRSPERSSEPGRAASGGPGAAYSWLARRLPAVPSVSRAGAGGGGPVVQAKLVVGGQDDPLEQEADRVADAVVAGGSGPGVEGTASGGGRVQRACAECQQEKEEEQQ